MPRLASLTSQRLAGLGITRMVKLLVNGDFATGDVTGWTDTSGQVTVVNQEAVIPNSVFGSFQQQVSVNNPSSASITYNYSIDVTSVNGVVGSTNRPILRIFDSASLALTNVQLINAQTYSGQFTTTEATSLTFSIIMNGLSINIDNAALSPA